MKVANTKLDLSDLTFVIPVRLDTIQRLENLNFVIKYFLEHFETKFIILEADSIDKGLLKKILPPEVELHFVFDENPIFHRTKYINQLAGYIQTEYIAVWDSDVIVPVEQLLTSISLLRSKITDFVLPYDGRFYDTGPDLREVFFKHLNLIDLDQNAETMSLIYGFSASGGGFLANSIQYLDAGLENEGFKGWGIEDGERLRRWEILGFEVCRIKGKMFHLFHPRGQNSSFENDDAHKDRILQYLRICRMSKDDLRIEVESWHPNRLRNTHQTNTLKKYQLISKNGVIKIK